MSRTINVVNCAALATTEFYGPKRLRFYLSTTLLDGHRLKPKLHYTDLLYTTNPQQIRVVDWSLGFTY